MFLKGEALLSGRRANKTWVDKKGRVGGSFDKGLGLLLRDGFSFWDWGFSVPLLVGRKRGHCGDMGFHLPNLVDEKVKLCFCLSFSRNEPQQHDCVRIYIQ